MLTDDLLAAQLTRTLAESHLEIPGATLVRGKVRDSYLVGDQRILVATDRVSAFDVVLGTIPFKGQVLNRMSAWWFAESAGVAPNHVADVPDPAVTIAWACEPLPVEFVMRGYLTGITSTSVWTHYSRGGRSFCGHALPDGMVKNQALPAPMLTPSTKAEKGGHDESLSRDDCLARGLLDAATFDEAGAIAARMFRFGQERARSRGLILADTKYELGRALAGPHKGRLILIDEVHTPDSSRYWFARDYRDRMGRGEEPSSLDKEYLRRWFAARGYTGDGTPPPMTDEVRIEAARRYIEAFELITGGRFIGDAAEPEARIRANLGHAISPRAAG